MDQLLTEDAEHLFSTGGCCGTPMRVRPTVFGTKVVSATLVFPVVIRVFCRMMLVGSFTGVFPVVVVDDSALITPAAGAAATACRGWSFASTKIH